MSIFGNYDFDKIRNIYKISHELITKVKKDKDDVDEETKGLIKGIFDDILYDSIIKTTSGMLKVIFKYSPENSLSAGDISTQLKKLQLQGIHVKYLIIDYLDVLKPTITYNYLEEHQLLGVITQELRTLSRIFGIPVITATQTSKEGDNIGKMMNNTMVGESWKKVKFSDFIYMQRVRDDLTIFSPEVSKFVFKEGTEYAEDSPRIIGIKDELSSILKPLEMRVSKSKEKGKGYGRFMLFCTKNLRLYNNIQEFLLELPELNSNSTSVDKRIKQISELVGVNLDLIENNFNQSPISSFNPPEENNEFWSDDAIGF